MEGARSCQPTRFRRAQINFRNATALNDPLSPIYSVLVTSNQTKYCSSIYFVAPITYQGRSVLQQGPTRLTSKMARAALICSALAVVMLLGGKLILLQHA
jgi:hypothetical protein